jgi:PAS domain S-box-containing protein
VTPPPDTGLEQRLGTGAAAVLQALVESIADAIYAVDPAGAVQFINPAAVRILGYDHEDELLGKPSHATIHHHHPDGTPFPEDACPLLRPRVTGEVVRVEEDWFVRRDGTFVPVAYSSAPVDAAGGGRGAVVVFRDVTERRAVEAARRREAVERARSADLRASRARIVEAQLDERRRMARDLHDGAQQRLVNVVIALQLALRSDAATSPAARDALQTALSETRDAVEELRELAAGLLPSVLTHRGLAGAIESLSARAPVPVDLDLTDARFPPAVEGTAYFVVAEALTNVAKHADATTASVRLHVVDQQRLVVEVRDDGRGGASVAAGRGLAGLADRVAALDGTLSVEDAAPTGQGTLLVATLPLSARAAA